MGGSANIAAPKTQSADINITINTPRIESPPVLHLQSGLTMSTTDSHVQDVEFRNTFGRHFIEEIIGTL
jgi:hypothetical protein